MSLVLAFTTALLFSLGTWLLLQRRLTRIIIGLGLIGHGANLLLLRPASAAASPRSSARSPARRVADPMPQALALTAIVISFGVGAFLLALAYRSWQLTGDDLVEDDVEDRRIAERAPARRRGARRPAAPGRSRGRGRVRCRRGDRRRSRRDARPAPAAGGAAAARRRPLDGGRPPPLAPARSSASSRCRSPRPCRSRSSCTSTTTAWPPRSWAGGTAPVGISLVADRLTGLMLVVASPVLLAVLVFAIGQPGTEKEQPRSTPSTWCWPPGSACRSSPATCSTCSSRSR